MGLLTEDCGSCWHQFKAKQVETAPLQPDDLGEDRDA